MSDILQNFTCRKCRHSVVEFDVPTGTCDKCGETDSYYQCASSVNTRLATEGILCEYTYDSAYTYDERNDKYTDEMLMDKERNAYGDIRSGKVKFEARTAEVSDDE